MRFTFKPADDKLVGGQPPAPHPLARSTEHTHNQHRNTKPALMQTETGLRSARASHLVPAPPWHAQRGFPLHAAAERYAIRIRPVGYKCPGVASRYREGRSIGVFGIFVPAAERSGLAGPCIGRTRGHLEPDQQRRASAISAVRPRIVWIAPALALRAWT